MRRRQIIKRVLFLRCTMCTALCFSTPSATSGVPVVSMNETHHHAPIFSPIVLCLLVQSMVTMLIVSCCETPLLLYMKHVDFVKTSSATFYVNSVAAGFLIPVFVTIPLGYFCARFGASRTLGVSYGYVAIGLATVALIRNYKYIFLIGYLMYSSMSGFRIIRFSVIGDQVPIQHRTLVMAVHQLMIPLGALLGPLVWLGFQTWRGEIVIVPSFVVLDRFSGTYLFGFLTAAFLSVISYVGLRPINPTPTTSSDSPGQPLTSVEHQNEYRSIKIDTAPESDNDSSMSPLSAEQKRYQKTRFVFFTLLIFCIRLTLVVVIVLLQPILVQIFGDGDEEIGKTYLIIGILALIPPVAVAALSKVLDDRRILQIGLLIKLVGISLYLPPFGWMGRWQAIIGYCLVVKATSFSTTASISLYTKVLGPICSAETLGYLWSLANVFPGLVQVMLASWLVGAFNSWWFACFVTPVVLALAMLLSPAGWSLLDPDSEHTKRMTRRDGG